MAQSTVNSGEIWLRFYVVSPEKSTKLELHGSLLSEEKSAKFLEGVASSFQFSYCLSEVLLAILLHG